MIEKSSEISELPLNTRGSKDNVSLGKLKAPTMSKLFTKESLDDFRSINSLSLNQTKIFIKLLRCVIRKNQCLLI